MSLNRAYMAVNGANSALMSITSPIKKPKTAVKWHETSSY